ncbi:hypothetical protein JMY79_19550 [Brenneria goodwinii]|uniref:hypothetical protein n=1 Tax=Brenneria goodwinii TaxID=1109412 RepID=UPI0015FF329D|nr:hypothetical protein [Brenneria goodwinii]MCG8167859.1 hypothetical protein [Brenneria goodwinii]MCG8176760.1 hypothetical protein [Brenneria goodwinii]MCG8181489.1 hypothetical protein [Brenneria goodwinii]
MFLMITDWIGYLSNQVDKVCREVCVAKADAFFFNQQTAAKLPLRTQQPLVSIQTRLIGDEGYHPLWRIRRGSHSLPQEFKISINDGENGYRYNYVRSSFGHFPVGSDRASCLDYAAAR